MLMGSSTTIPHFPQLTSDMAALLVSGGNLFPRHRYSLENESQNQVGFVISSNLARSLQSATHRICGSDRLADKLPWPLLCRHPVPAGPQQGVADRQNWVCHRTIREPAVAGFASRNRNSFSASSIFAWTSSRGNSRRAQSVLNGGVARKLACSFRTSRGFTFHS